MTRQQAIETEAPRYHGKPCKGCAATERYTSNGKCVACSVERSRTDHRQRYTDPEWVERHRAQARERQALSRLDGLEFVYECYSSEGELLYVGRTTNPTLRIRNHRRKVWWPDVTRVSWTQYPHHERQRIAAKNPKYNKHGVG